jgi:hypothetical protein
MPVKTLKNRLHQKVTAALPGPVIREEPVTAKTRKAPSGTLPRMLSLTFAGARAVGLPMKLVTCRKPGVAAMDDGSHEVSFLVPKDVRLPVYGTTI